MIETSEYGALELGEVEHLARGPVLDHPRLAGVVGGVTGTGVLRDPTDTDQAVGVVNTGQSGNTLCGGECVDINTVLYCTMYGKNF